MSWLPMFGIGALFGLLVAKDKKETELTQIHQALQEQVARQRDMNQMVQEEEDRKRRSAPPRLTGLTPEQEYQHAIAIAQKYNRCSIALLQRHISVTYSRAAVIMEKLQQAGVIR